MSATATSEGGEPALHETHLGRRQVLRLGAAGAAAAVGGGSVATDEADALAPLAIAGVAGIAAGMTFVAWDPLASESVPEGLTSGAFNQRAYEVARTRKSTNASTFVDNENLVEASDDDAYSKGKIAAIEALNDQQSESEVVDAAHEAVDTKQATVVENLIKSWNESVNELEVLYETASEHSDVSTNSVFVVSLSGLDSERVDGFGTTSRDLPDGSSIDVRTVEIYAEGTTTTNTHTGELSPFSNSIANVVIHNIQVSGSDSVTYLIYSEWNSIVSLIESTYSDVRDGLSTWVSGVYGDVQAGDLNPENLLSPAELADMMPDGEGYPQAIADLQALNQAVDLEREFELEFSNDATIYGTLAVSSEPADGVSAGDTINPSEAEEDFYFTYDISQGHGVWSDYETGVDGGTIVLTSEPYAETTYSVTTVAGETLELSAGDFSETEEGGAWTYDASGDLDTAITEVAEVTIYSDVEGTQFETVQLEEVFTVVEITNTESGETVDSANFTQNTTQTDDNYITQEEWDELREQNEKLIEKYEDAKNSGGGLFGDLFGGGNGIGIPTFIGKLFGVPIWLLALVVAYVANMLRS